MPFIYDAIEEYIITVVQQCESSLQIICPYIKVVPLQRIIGLIAPEVSVEIITTWKLGNFYAGVSDVEIYNFCKDNQIQLRANNRIHLKTWLIDKARLLGTSANITDSALGGAATPNYEFLTDTDASPYDFATFDIIKAESVDVSAEIFSKTLILLGDNEPGQVDEIALIGSNPFERLVDHIPRCLSPEDLCQYYENSCTELTEDALHDLECLRIPPGLNKEGFLGAVRKSFFRLPIIERVCDRLLEGPMFFGEVKEFLQSTNDSDPKPTRRALTPITQNLYRWMVALNPDVFIVDQPSHSERISILK